MGEGGGARWKPEGQGREVNSVPFQRDRPEPAAWESQKALGSLGGKLRRAGNSRVLLGPDSLQLNAPFLLSVGKELSRDRVCAVFS